MGSLRWVSFVGAADAVLPLAASHARRDGARGWLHARSDSGRRQEAWREQLWKEQRPRSAERPPRGSFALAVPASQRRRLRDRAMAAAARRRPHARGLQVEPAASQRRQVPRARLCEEAGEGCGHPEGVEGLCEKAGRSRRDAFKRGPTHTIVGMCILHHACQRLLMARRSIFLVGGETVARSAVRVMFLGFRVSVGHAPTEARVSCPHHCHASDGMAAVRIDGHKSHLSDNACQRAQGPSHLQHSLDMGYRTVQAPDNVVMRGRGRLVMTPIAQWSPFKYNCFALIQI
eukprot:352583-Chlamydomonas_euryale.AAC.1